MYLLARRLALGSGMLTALALLAVVTLVVLVVGVHARRRIPRVQGDVLRDRVAASERAVVERAAAALAELAEGLAAPEPARPANRAPAAEQLAWAHDRLVARRR